MKTLLYSLLFAFSLNANSQTFDYTGSLPTAIPDSNVNINFPINVSGLPIQIDSTYGLSSVCIDITHLQVSDLMISLTSPDSSSIILSLHNGTGGMNYTGTCLKMNAAAPLSQAIAPFTGNFLPDQSLNLLNNSQNPNGTWILSIIDVFPYYAGILNSVSIQFTNNPAPNPPALLTICSTTNSSSCTCKDSTMNDCDLLPDLICSYIIIRDGWGESNGTVDLPNAVMDVGSGPIEMKPTGNCFCDTVSVACTTLLCPSGDPPKERVNQRIYHKNPSGQMTFHDQSAGFQVFHPAHNHVHAENFCEFSLRVATSDPDPLNWPVIGTSLKEGYCMINMGTCDTQDSICMSNGQVITDSMLPNLNLGIVTGCGSQGQGLFVGRYDLYGSGFGQMISVPGICNGDYYIVTIIDPFNNFEEEDETNNVVAVPVHLNMQSGSPLSTSFTYATSGLDVAFFNFTAGVTRTWDFGDSTATVTALFPIHTYALPGIYNVKLTVFNGTCASTGLQSITVGTNVGINDNQSGLFDVNIYPNPSNEKFIVEYQLMHQSPIKAEILNVMGQSIKQVTDGMQQPGKHSFEINDLNAGSYFVRVISNDKALVHRIVKL
ncbi:MAG: T9SS type A sorting domain-containing protein [Bacteroidia bacterium]